MLAKALTIVAASLACALSVAPVGQAVPTDATEEPVPGYSAMGPAPEGANDWDCKPSAEHPRPVVLVHGTNSSMQLAWPIVSPTLKADGYCVFALNFGGLPRWYDSTDIVWGVNAIEQSAQELSVFVDAVLAHTGAAQVDLVGHSQGGVVSRQYLKYNGGADATDPARNKVHSVIALGPTNHGTTFNGMQRLYLALASLGLPQDLTQRVIFGLAGREQLVGSPLLAELNSGGETMPGVEYTVIASKTDGVITPPENSFLKDTTGLVVNEWVQNGCETRVVDHNELVWDQRSLWLVQAALDPGYSVNNPAPC